MTGMEFDNQRSRRGVLKVSNLDTVPMDRIVGEAPRVLSHYKKWMSTLLFSCDMGLHNIAKKIRC